MKLFIALLIELTGVVAYAAVPRIAPDEVRRLQLNAAPMELVGAVYPPNSPPATSKAPATPPTGRSAPPLSQTIMPASSPTAPKTPAQNRPRRREVGRLRPCER